MYDLQRRYSQRILMAMIFIAISFFRAHSQTTLPSARHKAVYGNGFYVSPSSFNYSSIANTIIAGKTSRYERAKSLYLWICANISFDTLSDIRAADLVWTKRRGVCQGYCELYYRLAESIGMKPRLIYGKSRNPDGRFEEHAWLEVDTERGTILLDPTWGAGAIVNGRFARLPQPLVWFDVDPRWFIFTHYPRDRHRQHIDPQITEHQFNSLPYATPLTSTLGIDPVTVLADLTRVPHLPVVHVASADYLDKIRIVRVPLTLHLHPGTPYLYIIEKLDPAIRLSLSTPDGNIDESRWQRTDQRYTLTFTPKTTGPLQLTIAPTQGFLQLLNPVIGYEVK